MASARPAKFARQVPRRAGRASYTPRVEWPRDPAGKRLRGVKLLRALFEHAKNENSSPRKVGFSVGAGVFVGFTPFIGFHIWIALAVATVCRLNRLWAALGSHASPLPIFVWASFCEIELGHRLRDGSWIALSPQDAFAQRNQLFGDWVLGSSLVATALALVAGLVAYALALGWQRRREARAIGPAPGMKDALTPRTLDELPPPSSGSPPSAPLDPTR